MTHIAWLYWNPEKVVFTIPIINHPVVWYGIWFAFGFVVGYILLIPMMQKALKTTSKITARDIASWPALLTALKDNYHPLSQTLSRPLRQEIAQLNGTPDSTMQAKILSAINAIPRPSLEMLYPKAIYTSRKLAYFLVDRMTWFIVAGTIIGARLGHVFFYDWPRYQHNLIGIVKVWEGGLASHGGGVGVLIGLYLYKKIILKGFPEFTFLTFLDIIVVPTAFVGFCIRIGNFMNQEVLGYPSTLPWAIIFGDPIDRSAPVPRHPAQLYEAVAYLLTFGLLYYLWKKTDAMFKPGILSGLFFILVFGSRFFLEFIKESQGGIMDEFILNTGQYLSLPYIFAGLALLFYGYFKDERSPSLNS